MSRDSGVAADFARGSFASPAVPTLFRSFSSWDSGDAAKIRGIRAQDWWDSGAAADFARSSSWDSGVAADFARSSSAVLNAQALTVVGRPHVEITVLRISFVRSFVRSLIR